MSASVADPQAHTRPVPSSVDAVVVGAGFSGMYLLHKLRALGLSTVVFEAGTDVGGTWYWNRYPGARVDVESLAYSYSFDSDLEQDFEWQERYPTQPEILRYAQHVAERFDLRKDIVFRTRVASAQYDEDSRTWKVRTEHGDAVTARFLVMATGCLSSSKLPEIPGLESYKGTTYHTAHWPHEGVDFTGLRVGLIGTGSSGVQSIPVIAEQAAELVVFQRTPAYTVPARNGPLDPDERAKIKAEYSTFRATNRQMPAAFGSRLPASDRSALEVDAEERRAEYEYRWQKGLGLAFIGAFNDVLISPESNESAAEFVRSKIRDIVPDPEVARKLTPHQVIGCKRLCLDTGYYETFNRPNVELVDLRDTPIEAITPTGIRTTEGEHELDCIVYATGFDAMTGALLRIDIRGRDGLPLQEAWAAGPRTYLGLGVAGFPNLFTITGPGSPSVLTNMMVSIEQHVNWIADCMDHLRRQGHRTIEASEPAQDLWVEIVNAMAGITLFPTCNSWYLGANVPGKTRVFMPFVGFPMYAEKCTQVAQDGYEGFVLSG